MLLLSGHNLQSDNLWVWISWNIIVSWWWMYRALLNLDIVYMALNHFRWILQSSINQSKSSNQIWLSHPTSPFHIIEYRSWFCACQTKPASHSNYAHNHKHIFCRRPTQCANCDEFTKCWQFTFYILFFVCVFFLVLFSVRLQQPRTHVHCHSRHGDRTYIYSEVDVRMCSAIQWIMIMHCEEIGRPTSKYYDVPKCVWRGRVVPVSFWAIIVCVCVAVDDRTFVGGGKAGQCNQRKQIFWEDVEVCARSGAWGVFMLENKNSVSSMEWNICYVKMCVCVWVCDEIHDEFGNNL